MDSLATNQHGVSMCLPGMTPLPPELNAAGGGVDASGAVATDGLTVRYVSTARPRVMQIVEWVERGEGDWGNASIEPRRQLLNRESELGRPDLGRFLRLRARVELPSDESIEGLPLYWQMSYADMNGQSVVQRSTTSTEKRLRGHLDATGWSNVVVFELDEAARGGFMLTASTDPSLEGALTIGPFECWHHIQLHIDAMSRPGPNASWSIDTNALVTELASRSIAASVVAGTELLAYRRMIPVSQIEEWIASLAQSATDVPSVRLAVVDSIGDGPSVQTEIFTLPPGATRMSLAGASYLLDEREWLEGVRMLQAGTGAELLLTGCALSEDGKPSSGDDRFIVELGVDAASGLDRSRSTVVELSLRVWTELSHYRNEKAIVVPMRWRERSRDDGRLLVDAIATTVESIVRPSSVAGPSGHRHAHAVAETKQMPIINAVPGRAREVQAV